MYEEISQNKRNSLFLIAVFCLVVMGIGYVVSAATGSVFFLAAAFVFAVVFSLNGYYFGDRMVLLASRARPADPERYRRLYNVVEELTLASGLPMPKLYIIVDDDAPNAFATGRDPEHASIAVTTALLDRLDREELQGVLAHELSHVGNRDILFATLVGVLVGIIALLCDFFLRYTFWGGGGRRNRSGGGSGGNAVILIAALVLAVLAPIAAKLIQLAISRQREYLADAAGAKMTRNPEGLARALEEIARAPGKLEAANRATQHLYFVNPMMGLKGKQLSGLFSTHPPVEERIKRLRGL